MDQTRRKLLASLGMAGAGALFSSSISGAADGVFGNSVTAVVYGGGGCAPIPDAETCAAMFVADIRSMTDVCASAAYYVLDGGKEGFFRYDASDTNSADNGGTVLVTAAGHRLKRVVTDGIVQVSWFGARGDGNADDTDAIQAAIDFVSGKKDGGTVYFPPGTYIVSPTMTRRIVLRSNVHVTGSRNAIVKVKPDAGNYLTVFGPQSNSTMLKNVSISQICIDQNGTNNTTGYVQAGANAGAQFAVMAFRFEGVTIDNVRFETASGINTVVLNGSGSREAVVRNCYFKFVRANGAPNYDHATVYFNCDNHYAVNNVFVADVGDKAYAAIETHNGLSVISGNVMEGYCTGVNVCSASTGQPMARASSDITVVGNTIGRTNHGIRLWPFTGQRLSNVTIAANTISVASADHREMTSSAISIVPEGVNQTLSGTVDNLTISDNTIRFQVEPEARTMSESFVYAIGLASYGHVRNVSVYNNSIVGAPLTAIRVGIRSVPYTYENIQLKHNMIVDAGIYAFAANAGFRSAIFLDGHLSRVYADDNVIVDTGETMRGFQSFYTNSMNGASFNDVSIRNNKATAKQGGYLLAIQAGQVDTGSKTATHYSESIPPSAKMSVELGDVIVLTGPLTTGQYYGYRVGKAGTFGTTGSLTATGAGGNRYISVSDASVLGVGDVIRIAGLGTTDFKVIYASGTTIMLDTVLSASVTDAFVTYSAPVLNPFGQLA
ncbi:glycosyl hydrolase family 28-related protein [Paenibacillus sp. GYB003]|uniref:glycosyl hydrolase family 28-related protein n=1 Tax=Paenibacillus sp. GYB003 TaxID=2994392 RepID=UPI002F966DCA